MTEEFIEYNLLRYATVTIKEWTDALRSGEYQQGTGCLRTGDDNFCCLGVLSDLAAPFGWNYNNKYVEYEFGSTRNITSVDSPDIERLIINDLIYMNDKGSSFRTIADEIEINFPLDYKIRVQL